jgi:hypothetical protein
MIGYMALKQGFQSVSLVPLPFIVYSVWCRAEKKFKAFSSDMAHRVALMKDAITGPESIITLAETEFQDQFFLPPPCNGPTNEYARPYRIDGMDLVDDNGFLNSVYHQAELKMMMIPRISQMDTPTTPTTNGANTNTNVDNGNYRALGLMEVEGEVK